MKTVDGKVAVKKDALIETAITGTDGKAAFKADLPVGFSYYDADALTTELAEMLIDRVLVYPDKRIEIAYKIQDIFD